MIHERLTKTQQSILDYLHANSGIFLSGKQIGRALGLGESVRTHITHMLQRGVVILTRPGGNGWTTE